MDFDYLPGDTLPPLPELRRAVAAGEVQITPTDESGVWDVTVAQATWARWQQAYAASE